MKALELNPVKLKKIISGGQQGADQGGLLAAKAHYVQTGGQAAENYATVKGRTAPWLKELGLTAAGTFPQRTRANIDASDATVVFASNFKSPGTKLTVNYAMANSKPVLCINTGMKPEAAISSLLQFLEQNRVETLNVAGNRDSREVGGEHACFAYEVMSSVLTELKKINGVEVKETNK